MPFKENFTGINEQDGEFVEIPPGVYAVIIQGATEATTSTGLNMIKVKFKILEGEYENSPLFTNVVFHEKMRGRNKHILKVLYQPCEEESIVDASAWKGRQMRVRVRTRWNAQFKRWISEITQWLYFTEEEEEKAKEEKRQAKESKDQLERIFGPETPARQDEEQSEEEKLPF